MGSKDLPLERVDLLNNLVFLLFNKNAKDIP